MPEVKYENLSKVNKPFMNEFRKKYKKIIKSGKYISGRYTERFEYDFALYNEIKYCITVGSGLDALTLAIKAFDFKKGSEIIVPANTYIATILPILHNQLKPVLIEPNIDTYNIDVKKIKKQITSKTKAILAVHLYGMPCNMVEIKKIATKHKLKIIEDCSQAHGASIFASKNDSKGLKYFNYQKVGTFGDVGTFSFYPSKNLGCLSNGGAIITNDYELEKKIRMLRNYGFEIKNYSSMIGYNSKIDEIQSAFLSVKLKSLDKINQHKRDLALIYSNKLSSSFKKPREKPFMWSAYGVYHIYNICHEARDMIKKHLEKNNIETMIHYPVPPHHQKVMSKIINKKFPITEKIHNTTLSLPISFYHTRKDIEYVVEVLNKC